VKRLPSFHKGAGVNALNGITRTGRYQARAAELKAAKH
jgi:hypothetical protein